LVAAQQSSWRLGTPELYNYKGKIVNGVCRQTSYETCGAASMVTLLNSKGISTTEGEMARLSMTAPRLGLSPHGAAYGLKRKLGQLGRTDDVVLKVPELKNLHKLPKPFLAIFINYHSLTVALCIACYGTGNFFGFQFENYSQISSTECWAKNRMMPLFGFPVNRWGRLKSKMAYA
jgi:hypothetical protein